MVGGLGEKGVRVGMVGLVVRCRGIVACCYLYLDFYITIIMVNDVQYFTTSSITGIRFHSPFKTLSKIPS